MKFSYQWLKELVGFRDTPQRLAEFLTLRAFEVEEVKKVGSDWTLDIKITANRVADASGHIGLSREIAALKCLSFAVQPPVIRKNEKLSAGLRVAIRIEDPHDCPRYTARVVSGITVGLSPRGLQQRLLTCGLQPINTVVDVANYVMLETGQPLHIFDFDALAGQGAKTIVVRRAKNNESLSALDGKIHALNPDLLIIADSEEPLAIAGIKGGSKSGVTERTKTILVESANFDPARIRIASQSLRLRTDASFRFEHGLDPNETKNAANRAAALIQGLAGGSILPMADAYPKKYQPRKILLRAAYANRLIGHKLSLAWYRDALARLGWEVAIKNKEELLVRPLSIRLDVQNEEDVIEAAARMLGYDAISPKFPEVSLQPAPPNTELLWEDCAKDVLVGLGFAESMLYEFTGDQELARFLMSPNDAMALENPASAAMRYLTPRLLIKYIVSAAENARLADTLRIFGVGKSFLSPHSVAARAASAQRERSDLVIIVAAKNESGENLFFELKGVVDQLLESLGIADHWYDDAKNPARKNSALDLFHPHRAAEIKVGQRYLGVMGEVSALVLDRVKLKGRLVAAEIDFDAMRDFASAQYEYQPVGKYPAVIRDLAVLVPAGVKTEEILNVIERVGGTLLVETELFDYFQDQGMEEQQIKSIAFHLTFQSSTRTLTEAEVARSTDAIATALEQQGWELRR